MEILKKDYLAVGLSTLQRLLESNIQCLNYQVQDLTKIVMPRAKMKLSCKITASFLTIISLSLPVMAQREGRQGIPSKYYGVHGNLSTLHTHGADGLSYKAAMGTCAITRYQMGEIVAHAFALPT